MIQKGNTANLKYDFTDLNRFVRLMDSAGDFVVKVGIFGNKNARGKTSETPAKNGGTRKVFKVPTVMTNAEVGLLHEVGSPTQGLAQRSFLRMPIAVKSKEILSDALIGAPELLRQGNIRGILKRLGISCEKWIQMAFASGGFGTWKPDSQTTVARKGSAAVLIDTAQLRRSISSQVTEK